MGWNIQVTKYFGVIGNRDHIKIKGEKRPFWEFLDVQPDGWLSSLVYARKDVPRGPMIWDCGAWSYKHRDVPLWDAVSVVPEYERFAAEGDLVLAPDHILIGDNLEMRRQFNLRSARMFLDTCPSRFTPMAVVHGLTSAERVTVARRYIELGYSHLALGGMASNAARKTLVLSQVADVRTALPTVYIHILGLSSPQYMREWKRLKIDSCDGSSHFKQAFTGGAFFTVEGSKLTKHKAARPGNAECFGITAPLCHCKCCVMLRDEGIDTRTFGSNEHNMGRAAHNLNMLMRAQRVAMQKHIVLVACCGQKLSHPAPAKEMYQSVLFKKSREFAERNGDSWLILSAKYGVVDPNAVIEPYDETLNRMPKTSRRAWAERVRMQLDKSARYTVLAGARYCENWIEFFDTHRPMSGMGIGQQLAWLRSQYAEAENNRLSARGNQADLFDGQSITEDLEIPNVAARNSAADECLPDHDLQNSQWSN